MVLFGQHCVVWLVHILVIAPANFLPASMITSFGSPFGMKNGVKAPLEIVIESTLSMYMALANELIPLRHVSTFNAPQIAGKSTGVKISREQDIKWCLGFDGL